MVVAPHPDDETIGCGASIAARAAAGTEVTVVIVTDGRHSHTSSVISPDELASRRMAESVAACRLLGLDDDAVRFLGYEEGQLWNRLPELAGELAALIAERRPDEVVVTSEHDWHDDHRAVNAAVRRAAARAGFTGAVAAYPVWYWADGPWRNSPTDTARTQLCGFFGDLRAAWRLGPARLVPTRSGGVDHAERKRAAFACYESQTTNLTGEADWATFPAGWIDPFCGAFEPFFPLRPDPHAGAEQVREQAAAGPATA